MRTLLVDANGLAHQLWWGMPPGVMRVEHFDRAIARVAEAQKAERVLVAWDHPGPTWRSTVLPEYKMHRGPKPAQLSQALIECRTNSTHRAVSREGYEADDVIATLAWAAGAAGDECVILTSDKDLAQLVTPRCWLVSAKGVEMREADVLAKFGVPPSRIRHLLSWTGDAVDGLPGKPGVGPKRGAQRANTGAIGDALTYELAGLATVPGLEVPPCEEGFA